MTETSKNPIRTLYQRLSEEKLARTYIRKVILPDWWQDSMAEAKSGYAEALSHIARHTGILIDSMLDDRYPLTFAQVNAKYYLGGRNTQNEISLAAKLATAAAVQLAPAIRQGYNGIPADPATIRAQVLESGAESVSFESLLRWCWSSGIGVLPVTKFPPGQTKMKALVTHQAPNPVIVLCENHKYHAWQLFHLAHEIGHLALQHVTRDTEWIDAEISYGTVSDEKYAAEENAATRFGVEIITGYAEPPLHSEGYLVAEQLVAYARQLAAKYKIDSGFIALNHGWRNKREGASMGALRILEENPQAQILMQKYLVENLDTELISDETLAYLLRLGQV